MPSHKGMDKQDIEGDSRSPENSQDLHTKQSLENSKDPQSLENSKDSQDSHSKDSHSKEDNSDPPQRNTIHPHSGREATPESITNQSPQSQASPASTHDNIADYNPYTYTYPSDESLSSGSVTSIDHRVNPIHDDEESQKASRHTSTTSKEVPRSKRRGLFSSVVLIPEYEDARDYSMTTKYIIVGIIAFASITGPMGSSIILPAIDDIVDNLDSNVSTVNVCVGIYLLSMGIFPLWWSALSELYGRRTVYFVSFVLFFAFSVGCAVSPSIGALIGLRVLQGGCSASVQALGAGTIADLFSPEQRGTAMGYYYLGPLCGPFFAPILGGIVSQVWGWRATQWLLVILAGINSALIIFGLPETLRKSDNLAAVREMLNAQAQESKDQHLSSAQLEKVMTNLSRRSSLHELEEELVIDHANPSLSRMNTNRTSYSRKVAHDLLEVEMRKSLSQPATAVEKGSPRWIHFKQVTHKTVIKPVRAVWLLTHPQIFLVVIYSSICFGAIYFFNLTISYEYARHPYNFKSIIVGLLYIPNSVTYIIASMIGGRWNDNLIQKHAEEHDGEFSPEARLSWNIVLAVVCYMPACFIFGWALKYGVHWVVPLVGTAFSGFASMLVIGATTTYLVDSLPGKGATGIALNNLCRQCIAAICTFVVEPLLRAIGPGILFSIVAGLILVGSFTLVVLKKKGQYIRDHFDLAALYEKL